LSLLLSMGLFGAAVAVLPGLATATNPAVTAGPTSSYSPMQVAITPGSSALKLVVKVSGPGVARSSLSRSITLRS
jgi:hypothetical protein